MSIQFNTVTWYSKLGAVILFILVVPTLTFYIGRKYQETVTLLEQSEVPSVTASKQSTLSRPTGSVDPLSCSYLIDGEQVTLVNGSSVEPIVSGSAATLETHVFGKPVYGDLNGDGQEDAIFFLYQETGGTGVFFYVAAAVNVGGSYVGTKAIFLGDRVAPQNITIAKGEALVNYVVRRDRDPMTALPSVGATKHVRIENGELVEDGGIE